MNKAKQLLKKLLGIRPKPDMEYAKFGCRYPDKKFLLIRTNDPGVGLFSHFITKLGWIKYAYDCGYIPIVDLKTGRNMYQKYRWPFRENAWEHFFRQPDGISMAQVRKARNVIIVRSYPSEMPNQSLAFFRNEGNVLTKWRKLVREHILIKDGILDPYVNQEFEEQISNVRVLGVLGRGTDYLAMRPYQHPIVPDADKLVEDAKRVCRDRAFEKVFLVTEDPKFECIFREAFGADLILPLQKTIKYEGGYLCKSAAVAGNIERASAYLKAIVDLSRCQGILAGRTSGAVGAALLSNGFEYEHYYDLGSYGISNGM